MALKPIACLCFFEQVYKHDDLLAKLGNGEQAIWKVTGDPGPPGHSVAIGSGSHHPCAASKRRLDVL